MVSKSAELLSCGRRLYRQLNDLGIERTPIEIATSLSVEAGGVEAGIVLGDRALVCDHSLHRVIQRVKQVWEAEHGKKT